MQTFLTWLVGVAQSVGLKLLGALLTLLIGSCLIKIIVKFFPDGKRYDHVDPTARSFMRSFMRIGMWVILCVCVIAILGVPMASVVAAVASCGVAIGLAMQGSLSNLAGGIMLLLFRPFKIGDYIEANGHGGTVVELGIFYTVFCTPDNKTVTIPNGSMMNNPVVNYSTKDTRRVDMSFQISYGADADAACALAKDIASAHELVLKDKDVFSKVTLLGESAVTVTVRVWANSGDYWTVNHDLIRQIRKAYVEAGIEIPYNQIDIHIKNEEK
jgi:small conductance mechanosensitive channel